MNAVVLTFPGHFFQTAACLRSLHQYYPETTSKITIIADDVQCAPWHSYIDDVTRYLGDSNKFTVIATSSLPGIRDCVAGWWRQQLIKLTLDQISSDTEWFVVDGDVIFFSRCDIHDCVPISRRYDPASRWNQMCVNYVQGVLGTKQGAMHDQDQPVITSPIPFRHLDRDLLIDLRRYVESRFANNFVDLHLNWFQDQTIVADIDPPTRWVMSEWELIECFRRMVQGNVLPYHDIGSGYQIDADRSMTDAEPNIFLHSYQRDTQVGIDWFQSRGIRIDHKIWQNSMEWYDIREVQRLM